MKTTETKQKNTLTFTVEIADCAYIGALKMAVENATRLKTRNDVAKFVAANGFNAHVGGHHVAVIVPDNTFMGGERAALITGTGEDWVDAKTKHDKATARLAADLQLDKSRDTIRELTKQLFEARRQNAALVAVAEVAQKQINYGQSLAYGEELSEALAALAAVQSENK